MNCVAILNVVLARAEHMHAELSMLGQMGSIWKEPMSHDPIHGLALRPKAARGACRLFFAVATSRHLLFSSSLIIFLSTEICIVSAFLYQIDRSDSTQSQTAVQPKMSNQPNSHKRILIVRHTHPKTPPRKPIHQTNNPRSAPASAA